MNLAGLHRLVPNPKTITYEVSTSSGFNSGVTVAKAESRPTTDNEGLLIGGTGKSTLRTFHVWQQMIGTIKPKIGDKITDEKGDTWIVESKKGELDDQRFRLVCKATR